MARFTPRITERELRRAVTFAIAAAGGDVTAITKNARTFSECLRRL